MSKDLSDVIELKRLYDVDSKSSKCKKDNNLVVIEWYKRKDELLENISMEKNINEIQMFELEQERSLALRLKEIELKKSEEHLKAQEYLKDVQKIKDKIIENTNLGENYTKACDKLKSAVQDLVNDVDTFESNNTFKKSRNKCQQLKEEIKMYVDGKKEKKNELMKLSLEYLHPSNWKKNLINLVILRKKKLLQQTGLKIVKENNKLIKDNNISENRRQKIQHVTQKIFDDLRAFDKTFKTGDLISYME
uniref:Uncharacterized protein n=1 Tax=Strongyloides stercoralis TaxID=6248 RepID=A0A0K0DZ58_STRER